MRSTINNNGIEEVEFSGDLVQNRAEAFLIVKENFEHIAKTNTFITSLGFEADNRWIDKNDIDNATCCIEAWFEGQEIAYFRDTQNETHVINLEQLKLLKKEAQQNRLLKLSTKWKREYFIELATSLEQVWNLVDASEEYIQSIV